MLLVIVIILVIRLLLLAVITMLLAIFLLVPTILKYKLCSSTTCAFVRLIREIMTVWSSQPFRCFENEQLWFGKNIHVEHKNHARMHGLLHEAKYCLHMFY